MILYFADRKFNILGQASTRLPDGILVKDDLRSEEVETGVAVFDGYVQYTAENRKQVESCTAVGNYILRKNGDECEFYTIIESEANTKNQEVYVYAEDAGLDLLNEVVGAYEADKAYPISTYIDKFAYDSGFEIGINEAVSLSRKLSWDGESTVTERLESAATQFGCEISYSFAVKGLEVTHKYINIYKKRGKDLGIQLRLNYDIDNIVTKKSIANLATGLEVTGGTPEDAEDPITLKGYTYDDGDFFVSGTRLYSRKANQKWSRYIWNKEPNKLNDNSGYIVKTYSYDTTSQSELCSRAVTELKKLCDIEVNYEVEIAKLPDNVRIGDRVDIVDDAGELYASARVLKLESSAWNDKNKATLGEFLIKPAGISQKVLELAEQFAKTSLSAERAEKIAEAAKQTADTAQETADAAVGDAKEAQQAAEEAQQAADTAQVSAEAAQQAADAAQSAVVTVEESVQGLQETVDNAQAAADQAYQAAETAGQKADQAAQSATAAAGDAAEAKEEAAAAQEASESAVTNADAAKSTAAAAAAEAGEAKITAEAAKQDAQAAQNEIDALGENLTTLSNTMEAEYARKTDLTEAEAALQTQIEQNAAQISSTASKVETIDETANNAAAQAAAAQSTASSAQEKADQASADADAAQTAADQAAAAAQNAQGEADTAKAAAQTAQDVADKAKSDLEAAKADLATVQSRVDATEEEIAAAQAAVDTAQAAADKAQADAETAVNSAATAQTKADNAATAAQEAQTAANDAASKANAAQKVADEAKGDAQAAQELAQAAQDVANAAQNTANTAKTNAAAAQAAADTAAQTAAQAQQAADDADAKAAQAAEDLAEAQQNLADVTSRVGATEEEVAAAQAAVTAAQEAADQAAKEAASAQSAADTAKSNAEAAQKTADAANTAAQEAQTAADNAQAAADQAQEAVDALAVRVTNAETNITQNAEAIALAATKTEVEETLGGYYTKEQTDAAIQLEAEGIKSTVSAVKETAESAQESADGAYDLAAENESQISETRSEVEQLSDALSTLIVGEDGETMMEQTDEGWRFNMNPLLSQLEDARNDLDGQRTEIDGIDTTISNLDSLVDDITEKTAYITMSTDEKGDPCIELGKQDSPFKLRITNESIDFVQDGVKIAYITNRQLYIQSSVVTDEMKVGAGSGFIWKKRQNGNMGLRWIEGR